MRTLTSKLDFLRVRDWIYLLGISCLVLAHEKLWSEPKICALALAFNAVYLCWGYVFNNAFDRAEDSKQKNAFLDESRRVIVAVTGVLSAALAGFAVVIDLFIPTLIVMAINAVYSVPPLRLKRFIVSSLIANGVFFGFVAYATSVIVRGELGESGRAIALFVFFLFLPIQYVHSLEHREEAGVATTSIERAIAVGLFVVLALLPFCPALTTLHDLRLGTLIYVLIATVLILKRNTAAVSRGHLRWLSAVFGLFLLTSFALN